ncbi:MAG: hypothetical protein E6J91_45310 [Deltaproteobacteria bacterium]|nr:MAG: hypothetical protein E6J91_45310 [Deltaproteobacteria bacterium]
MRHLAISLALLAACGTDSVSIDSYPVAVRDTFCRYLARCGDVESVDTCKKINIGFTVHVSESQLQAIDAGKSRYHGDNAAACLDAFASRNCDVTSQSNRFLPDACLHITTGTVHASATCALDSECISLVCDVPACPSACCMGTCAGDTAPTRAKLGQSCELANCDANSFCDDVTLVCTALKASGAFCGSSSECQYGLDCDPTGTCTSLPKLGESCSGACRDEGTTCSATSRTCVKVALGGATCTVSGDCSPLYFCDASKHCSGGLALGAPCTGAQRCADDRAFCDVPAGQTMGMCALPKANGMACQRNAACDSLFCDLTTQMCGDEPACF